MILDGVRLMQSVGSLLVLAAVVRGSQQAALRPHLEDIVGVITEPALCRVADVSDMLNYTPFYVVYICKDQHLI